VAARLAATISFASTWVIGIQGMAQFGTINSSTMSWPSPEFGPPFKVKDIETVTGRLGYTITPVTLAYVKGGAAWASSYGAAVVPALGGLTGEYANFTMTGYTVGAGLEWMFAPGWSVFGEYNYMDFGTKSVNFPSTGLVPGFGLAGALADTNAVRLTIQTATVGVTLQVQLGRQPGRREVTDSSELAN